MVNPVLRFDALRAAHRTAAVEAVDPSTPTTIPRRSDWSGISVSLAIVRHFHQPAICSDSCDEGG